MILFSTTMVILKARAAKRITFDALIIIPDAISELKDNILRGIIEWKAKKKEGKPEKEEDLLFLR